MNIYHLSDLLILQIHHVDNREHDWKPSVLFHSGISDFFNLTSECPINVDSENLAATKS